MYGDPDATSVLVRQAANQFNPLPPGGLFSIQPMDGWSHILIPDKETLVTDSGKLDVLDDLLMRLKAEGHRVLIYSQMTRMIDLLEEYMWHRKHTYMRLDGSSKISDRRDMVAGFQTRSDIFVFLLSTRAGGLGINLTAADTVIFYDSDWNPTVDQQAMDRAHRLGQTKQVTVYRLVCKGSIEERILQRAREKSEIQRMVISGGNFKPDTLKPKEVVSLLLDDEELEKKFRQRQEERRKEQEEANVDSGQRRKYKGAKRGPKPKRKKLEENITTPAPSDPATPTHQDGDSVLSVDSIPQSPYSELSVNSLAMAHDDTSSEGPLVVDDGSPSVPPPTKVTSISGLLESQTSNPSLDPTLRTPSPAGIKRGSGRGRGRPRGSGRRGGRGRGVSTLAVAAAEMAAAQAGKSAYAVYSYGLSGSTSGTGRGSVRGRGSGVARGHRGPPRVNHSQKSPSEGQSAEPVKTSTSLGFYVQNSPQ
ncbi:chromatin-remodeling ATPase INO80-like isoform X1 [Tachypleus tridentatus]